MILSWGLPIDCHSKVNWLAVGAWTKHEMQVTGVETKDDLSSTRLKYSGLRLIDPLAGKRPLVQSKMNRQSVEMLHVSLDPARRGKVLRARIAEVGFGRANVAHVGGSLHSLPMNADSVRRHRLCICLFQQLLDPSLGLVIVALAEVLVSHFALGVDEVVRRPVFIVKGIPDRLIAIECNGIGDAKLLHCLLYIRHLSFKVELRRMDSDHHQTAVLVLVRPRADIRDGAKAIDAGIGPEVYENDLPSELLCRQGRRIDPAGRARQAGQRRVSNNARRLLCFD